jgi:hypothetical protein
MKAMTTSMRSADWISVRSWLPTLGSPGAFVSRVVSRSGDERLRDALGGAVGKPGADGAQDAAGNDRDLTAGAGALDAGLDLLDELSGEGDAGRDPFVIVQ